MNPIPRLCLIAGALAALAAAPLVAQDTRPESRPAGRHSGMREFESYSSDWASLDLNNHVAYLISNVRLKAGDIILYAENVIVWLSPEMDLGGHQPKPEAESRPKDEMLVIPEELKQYVREIYAEGAVIMQEGDEVHRCDSAYLDLAHDRGLLIDARTSYQLHTVAPGSKLYIRADELRFLSQTQMQAVGASATTCSFGNPHYHVSSDRIEILRQRAIPADPSAGTESRPSSIHYSSEGNTLVIGNGFPAVWLPDFAGDTASPEGETFRYIKEFRFRSSNIYGREIGVTIGDNLETDTGEKWGTWGIDLDYRSKRGPGAGIDFSYHQPDFKGHIKTYYQRDHGEDKFYGEPPTKNRGRISFQQRNYLPLELQLDLEANVFSDRGFYPTFYENEYKGAKPPETYAYLKRSFQNSAITALFSTRLNHWETVTEYRPKIDYWLVTEPVAEVFDNEMYFSTRAEVSQVRLLNDKDLGIPARSTWRADVDNVLEYPVLVGPVKLTPFGGVRETWYETDLVRNHDQFRTGLTYGGEVSLIAWKTFDASGGIFGLDGVRHIVEPRVRYSRTTGVDLHPDELVTYDQVDLFNNDERLTFELRNLFQTIRHRATGAAVDEFFDANLSIDYFPDSTRDNGGDNWSNLVGDTVLRFSDELQFITDFEVNTTKGSLDEFNVAAGYAPTVDFQTYAGFRHFQEDWDVIFAQINWRPDEKWLVRLYTSYDLDQNSGIRHELVLSQLGHDWVLQLILRADYTQNDFSVSFGIDPRVLFDPYLGPKILRREPELQYLGSTIHK